MVISASKGASLTDLSRRPSLRFVAVKGENSSGSRSFGRRGQEVKIPVPPGTTVLNERGEQASKLLEWVWSTLTSLPL